MCYLYPTRTFSMGVLFAFSTLPFSYSTHNSYDRREIFRSPSLPPSLLPFLPAWQPIGQLFPAGRIGYSPPPFLQAGKSLFGMHEAAEAKRFAKTKERELHVFDAQRPPVRLPIGDTSNRRTRCNAKQKLALSLSPPALVRGRPTKCRSVRP